MEQTISKFPNPFGSVAPHKLFAWGLSATVGYGFAIWGVRIYQNQTVELGGQLLVVLMQAFVLPALLYGADRLRRRAHQRRGHERDLQGRPLRHHRGLLWL